MAADDLLNDPVSDLASRLEAMTDDEVFTAMSTLEAVSEGTESADQAEIVARIALIEVEIERRFPGQLLAPYCDWKKRNLLM
ncbi:hypothetical protein JNB71_13355 [Rhizobium herbae]|uniref:Uncharacterized protein n=1 Tax=Rhizobium herbae TaxID=508661 RepID=A0ABS7HB27_9HYPH|nr:hypothetical protein [Rhizobium herbae]MBW9064308.1 hypothetical protein [Rhizobium herbae]